MSTKENPIDALIYESGIIAQGCFDKYDVDALKKFAELIVGECVEVASSYDGAHYVGTAIAEHFGVKQ